MPKSSELITQLNWEKYVHLQMNNKQIKIIIISFYYCPLNYTNSSPTS